MWNNGRKGKVFYGWTDERNGQKEKTVNTIQLPRGHHAQFFRPITPTNEQNVIHQLTHLTIHKITRQPAHRLTRPNNPPTDRSAHQLVHQTVHPLARLHIYRRSRSSRWQTRSSRFDRLYSRWVDKRARPLSLRCSSLSPYHPYTNTHTYTQTHTDTHTYAYTQTHRHTDTHTHRHTHRHTHTYTHTHTHAHTHTHRNGQADSFTRNLADLPKNINYFRINPLFRKVCLQIFRQICIRWF